MSNSSNNRKPVYTPLEDRPWLVSYGRRKSRKLSPHKAELMDTLLPRIAIRLEGDTHHPENQPAALAQAHSRIWVEIGFGGGEHLAEQAAAHPDVLVIGCEPYIDGVAKLLADVDARGLENIRVLSDDARMLLDALPEGSIERLFILFPDPWPKARHHKRRIVSQETLDSVARVLKQGASCDWRPTMWIMPSGCWSMCWRMMPLLGKRSGIATGKPRRRTGCKPATRPKPALREGSLSIIC